MHGGDQLARGARKAQFPPAGNNTSQESWDSMFQDFNLEEYLKKESKISESNSSSNTVRM